MTKQKLAWEDWPQAAKDLGHYNMRIAKDGTWFHDGREIKRHKLVKLFASVLRRDEQGQYWLNTPVEKGRIDVEDAPFIITQVDQVGSEDTPVLRCTTNVETQFDVDADHPIKIELSGGGQEPSPYALVKPGLWGRLQRSAFYHLIDQAEERDGRMILRSAGQSFDLGALDEV